MLTKVIVGVSVLSLVFPAMTSAQGFSQGDKAATLSGRGLSDNEFVRNDFAAQGSLSYFLTDAWELAIRQELGLFDVPGSDDEWSASTLVALAYNFDLGNWWPFVGVNFGYVYGDLVDDTFAAGPEVGVRYFVNETTFILGSIQYEFFFEDSDDVDSSFDDGQFIYTLGVGFRWQ